MYILILEYVWTTSSAFTALVDNGCWRPLSYIGEARFTNIWDLQFILSSQRHLVDRLYYANQHRWKKLHKGHQSPRDVHLATDSKHFMDRMNKKSRSSPKDKQRLLSSNSHKEKSGFWTCLAGGVKYTVLYIMQGKIRSLRSAVDRRKISCEI